MASADKKRKNHDVESWHYRGVKRRDFRHSKDGPEVSRTTPSRKNKARFCKKNHNGSHEVKFGVTHYTWFWSLICTHCGKIFSGYDALKGHVNFVSEDDRLKYIRTIDNDPYASELDKTRASKLRFAYSQ